MAADIIVNSANLQSPANFEEAKNNGSMSVHTVIKLTLDEADQWPI